MLSVILVQYNNAGLTKKAIESFRNWVLCDHEILLVDNASTDADARKVFEHEEGVRCIFNNENLGFGKANNIAARNATGDTLLFLNNDTITTMDFASPILREFGEDPALGIAGPRLLNADGSFQISGGSLPTFAVEIRDKLLYYLVDKGNVAARNHAERRSMRNREVGWVTGAALFIKADLFNRLGGFDDSFFMFFEDKDLCLRARNVGYSVRYVPEPALVHLRGGSSRSPGIRAVYRDSQKTYYGKHRPWVERALLNVYLTVTAKGDESP